MFLQKDPVQFRADLPLGLPSAMPQILFSCLNPSLYFSRDLKLLDFSTSGLLDLNRGNQWPMTKRKTLFIVWSL